MTRRVLFPVLFVATIAVSAPVHAYFGPGAGITMLGALWGVLLAVLFAVIAVFLWPIRAMLRRRRGAADPANDADKQPVAHEQLEEQQSAPAQQKP